MKSSNVCDVARQGRRNLLTLAFRDLSRCDLSESCRRSAAKMLAGRTTVVAVAPVRMSRSVSSALLALGEPLLGQSASNAHIF